MRRAAARSAYGAARAEIARAQLAKLPLDRIKDITQGRLRINTIERAGCQTVGDVLGAGRRLETIPGVGPEAASKAAAAARQLLAALTEETRVRFDPDDRTAGQARLLGALRDYEQAKQDVPVPIRGLDVVAADLDAAVAAAAPAASKLRMFFAGSGTKAQARDGLVRLTAILALPATTPIAGELRARLQQRCDSRNRRPPSISQLWDDYLARSAEYNGLLIEVAGLDPDATASHGYLSAEIAQRIHDHPLDLSLVTASLRGYQAFGPKFALAQERVIIGDEMGLGKTVQALTTVAHLAADGGIHFLVVCPASVIVNWTRETGKHTKLTPYRLHGPEQVRNYRLWSTGAASRSPPSRRCATCNGSHLDSR